MHQDVAGFRAFLGSDDAEQLAAKLMGRWRSGAPLALPAGADDPSLTADGLRADAFDYTEDPVGYICPRGAHVRRARPRDGSPTVRRRRLIRRGMPYGQPLPDAAGDDGVGRGLVGIFLNADIERQYEFVQRQWLECAKLRRVVERGRPNPRPGRSRLHLAATSRPAATRRPPAVRYRARWRVLLRARHQRIAVLEHDRGESVMAPIEPPAGRFLAAVEAAEQSTPLPPPPPPAPDQNDPRYLRDPQAYERDRLAVEQTRANFAAAARLRGGAIGQLISDRLRNAPLAMLQELLDAPADQVPIFAPVIGPAIVARRQHVLTCLTRDDLFTVDPYAAKMARGMDDPAKGVGGVLAFPAEH